MYGVSPTILDNDQSGKGKNFNKIGMPAFNLQFLFNVFSIQINLIHPFPWKYNFGQIWCNAFPMLVNI